MKKILSVAAAIALAAALISCGDSSDEFSGAVDTVITVGTPKVTAKAYPGVNYISWEPVAQAKSYELYRTEDGANTGATLLTLGSELSYEDVAGADASTIVDGKSYKYTVIAVGANATGAGIPERAVYLKSSQGSATVTAKVPQSGTAALDLNKDYASKLNEKNVAKNVLARFVEEGENAGKIYYEFPVTAAYKYSVAFLADGEYESQSVTTTFPAKSFKAVRYLENYKVEGTKAPTNPGKYNVYIAVDSVSLLYPTSYVNTGVSVEVAKLVADDNYTNPVTAAATYTAEKAARIYWGPAKKTVYAYKDDFFPVENYKVYKSAQNDIALKPVTAQITEGVDKDGNKIYYVDDTVEDNKVTYTYTIVLTDGVRYGTAQTATLAKRAQTKAPSVTTSVTNFNKDGLTNDIKVVVAAGNDANNNALPTTTGANAKLVKADKTVTLYWINLAEKETTTAAATWTKVDLAKTDDFNYDASTDTYIWYKEDADAGVYLFKAVAHEAGYLDSDEAFGALVTVNGIDKIIVAAATRNSTSAGINATLADSTTSTTTDAYAKYDYSLLTVTNVINGTTGKETVTSTTPTAVSITAAGEYEVTVPATIAAGTTINYYLIRTRK